MNSLFERPFTFDRVTRIVFSIVIIGALLYLIAVLRNALLPFLIAWLLAYLMQPFVKFFQYKLKLKSRILAIVAVILFRFSDHRSGSFTGYSIGSSGGRQDTQPDAHA